MTISGAAKSSETKLTVERLIDLLVADVSNVVLGKESQIRMALACLIAGGHLLLEDLPGMGKTTLSHALAAVLGLEYKRVQFTSDLLPSDILGVSVFDRSTSSFHFHPGPVFTQLLLADEINRTTPKTQSALLEAMAERQVTIDGETRPLPQPFFVIATQNPLSQSGTFPLPESQLDRFLMRLELGYPDAAAEMNILRGGSTEAGVAELKPRVTLAHLQKLQRLVDAINVSDPLLDYVQRLVAWTRDPARFTYGLSTRGALALVRAAKAWALIHGRDHVLPDDVQKVLPAVAAHRLREAGDLTDQSGFAKVERMLSQVDVFS